MSEAYKWYSGTIYKYTVGHFVCMSTLKCIFLLLLSIMSFHLWTSQINNFKAALYNSSETHVAWYKL